MTGRHLLLVGLPGSGKTTAGAHAAQQLAIPFHDADQVIEAREGVTVASIFATRGEAAFRRLERETVDRLMAAAERSVIAPGGGWSAEPGNLERVAGRALVIHLSVTPETAAARLGSTDSRPLLVADPLERLRELAQARQAFYERAEAVVSTEGRTVEEVAGHLVELARAEGG